MGRFSSDNRQNSRDIYSILAEREAMAARKKTAPGQAQPPVAQPRPVAPQPEKKAPRKGTKVFWLSCLIFVAVFYVATFIGLQEQTYTRQRAVLLQGADLCSIDVATNQVYSWGSIEAEQVQLLSDCAVSYRDGLPQISYYYK